MDGKLTEILQDIRKSIDEVKTDQSKIKSRLDVIEEQEDPSRHDHNYFSRSRDAGPDDSSRQNGRPNTRDDTRGNRTLQLVPDLALDDIQQEFAIIKDSLQRVRLPKDLKVEDSRQGVKRNDQGRINNIAKCARYSETALKILSTIDPFNVTQADLNDLVIVNVAMVRYLQEEHALVHVGGSFGDNVERIYRNFRRNTSVFDSQAIDSLQAAVALDAAQPHSNYPSARGRGRGFQSNNYFRGRGRGAYNNSNSVYRFSRNLQGNNQFQNPNNQPVGGQAAGGDNL
jgi:hypothetical protein